MNFHIAILTIVYILCSITVSLASSSTVKYFIESEERSAYHQKINTTSVVFLPHARYFLLATFLCFLKSLDFPLQCSPFLEPGQLS